MSSRSSGVALAAKPSDLHQQMVSKPGFVPYRPHSGEFGLYLRDIILGINDGTVSMFNLLVGVTGGNSCQKEVLLAGITGMCAGAISMAMSEFIATKSQTDVTVGDIALEKEHFKHHRHVEVAQVQEVFQELGLQEKTLEKAVAHVGNSDATLMAFMKAFEFGCNDEDLTRSPYRAGATAGGLFSFGALPAVLTFGLLDRTNALIFGSLACCLVLFMVGACKTKLTRTNPIWAGLENMMCGASGAALCFAVGLIYDKYFPGTNPNKLC